MLEIARYEASRKLRGALVLAVLVAAMVLLEIAIYPSIQHSGVDLDKYMASMPPAMQAAFGNASLTTIQGFLSIEIYQFLWLLLLGLYVAYQAGALIAEDVERDRMDVLLSMPVSRSSVLVEKFLSLLTTIVVLNVVTPVVVYVGTVAVGEPIPVSDLVMVHLLSIPYLLTCGALGLLLSVAFQRADLAQRTGLGLVFALFLVDSVSASANMDWLGTISPTHYYDPSAILTSSTYDWTGAAVLLLATAALVLVSRAWFQGADLR